MNTVASHVSLAALALTLVGLGLGQALAAPVTPELQPQTLTVPESSRLFPGTGAGATAANSYCLMCHSAGMVLNQPALSDAAWLAEVNKMKNTFKAPIPDDQVQLLVHYLSGIQGAH